MKRGEIYFAQLDPTVGQETKKTRPVLIISNNANNKMANTVTIIPLTSNINKIYPFEVLLPKNSTSLTQDGKAMCNQIRTISKQRINQVRLSILTNDLLTQIEKALKLHLDMY